ncbi:MAG: hypothetical protein IPO04_08405 [Cytophagaceae bacterium]|nr:hypothetical protein [Cytophagaceae bacterium]
MSKSVGDFLYQLINFIEVKGSSPLFGSSQNRYLIQNIPRAIRFFSLLEILMAFWVQHRQTNFVAGRIPPCPVFLIQAYW